MEPQGWRTSPLLQSTKRTGTAVLKKTTRTESVHVQAVGLDAGNLPGTEPVEKCFLLTSPFIGPRAGRQGTRPRDSMEGSKKKAESKTPHAHRAYGAPTHGFP